MLKKHASRTADSFVELHGSRKSAAVHVIPSDDSGMARRRSAVRSGLPESNPAAASAIVRPGYARTSLCLSVLAAFAEGFGAYSLALYPTADFPLETILVARKETLPQPGSRELATAGRVHEANLLSVDTRVGGGSAPPDASLPWYRNLPALAYDKAAASWAHWRREREIRKAVAALAQFDDRSLRDMGISSRSEIEQVVRYCHDC
jgi:uncharacterized protein YjiS (DUF1127 family)